MIEELRADAEAGPGFWDRGKAEGRSQRQSATRRIIESAESCAMKPYLLRISRRVCFSASVRSTKCHILVYLPDTCTRYEQDMDEALGL